MSDKLAQKLSHLMSWETKTCLRCGLSPEEAGDDYCSYGIGTKNSREQYTPPPFRYSVPLVAPIRVQTPCRHEDVNWAGTCYDCGKEDVKL